MFKTIKAMFAGKAPTAEDREEDLARTLNDIKEKLLRLKISDSDIKMIDAIVRMDELTARDIMIPRVDVLTLDISPKREVLVKLIDETSFSRIPVWEDRIDNIKGILHVKDLYKLLMKSPRAKTLQLTKYLGESFFIPEAKRVSELLNEFQINRQHLAVVVDEYGGFAGIVTFEDVLEAFLGDIQDEFDEEQDEIKKISEKAWSLDARTTIGKINSHFHLELAAEEAETIGGYVIMKAGCIPKLHQAVQADGLKFKVLAKRKNSLMRLRLELKQALPGAKKED